MLRIELAREATCSVVLSSSATAVTAATAEVGIDARVHCLIKRNAARVAEAMPRGQMCKHRSSERRRHSSLCKRVERSSVRRGLTTVESWRKAKTKVAFHCEAVVRRWSIELIKALAAARSCADCAKRLWKCGHLSGLSPRVCAGG